LFLLQEGTIGHDLVVKPVPESVQQHLDRPLHSKHGDDDEIFLDEDGEDIKEDVAVKSGFPLRRIRSTKSQQHIVYRRSSARKELESSDYGSVSKSNTIRFQFLIHFKCTFQNVDESSIGTEYRVPNIIDINK
jgi:hypothetical protein